MTTAHAAHEAGGPAPFLFRLRAASVGYGAEPVLRAVEWEVHEGETWFLLGRNGSGKTTLLRALLGLLPIAAGTLERDPTRASRARIGFVPQRCEISPSLPTTVREFVLLGLVGLPSVRSERAERLGAALARTGLAGLAEHSYWSLSGGQRQRALVARALVRDPALLIFDEATSALDAQSERLVQKAVDRLMRGRTVVVIAHRLSTVRKADQIVVLENGAISRIGSHEELLEEPGLYRDLVRLQV